MHLRHEEQNVLILRKVKHYWTGDWCPASCHRDVADLGAWRIPWTPVALSVVHGEGDRVASEALSTCQWCEGVVYCVFGEMEREEEAGRGGGGGGMLSGSRTRLFCWFRFLQNGLMLSCLWSLSGPHSGAKLQVDVLPGMVEHV